MSDRDEVESRLATLRVDRTELFEKLRKQEEGIKYRLSKLSVERRALEAELMRLSQLVNEIVKVDGERRTLTTVLHSLDEAA